MIDGQRRAALVVQQHAARVGDVQPAVGQHDRRLAQQRLDLRLPTDGVEDRTDEDDAVHLLLRHRPQIAHRRLFAAARIAEDDLIAAMAERLLDGICLLRIVRHADIYRQDGHRAHGLADHAAGNRAGRVAAAREHRLHLGAGRIADRPLVVDHAGNRRNRHARLFGNIVDVHRSSSQMLNRPGACCFLPKGYRLPDRLSSPFFTCPPCREKPEDARHASPGPVCPEWSNPAAAAPAPGTSCSRPRTETERRRDRQIRRCRRCRNRRR